MTLLPLSQGIERGHSVYLHCQASGIPVPLYVWTKDGEGTIESSERRQVNFIFILSIFTIILCYKFS